MDNSYTHFTSVFLRAGQPTAAVRLRGLEQHALLGGSTTADLIPGLIAACKAGRAPSVAVPAILSRNNAK